MARSKRRRAFLKNVSRFASMLRSEWIWSGNPMTASALSIVGSAGDAEMVCFSQLLVLGAILFGVSQRIHAYLLRYFR